MATKPNVVFFHPLSELSDDEAKERAQQIYCTIPVVRLSDIARRVGRSKEQIAAWRDESNWLELRTEQQQGNRKKLLKKVGDPNRAKMETLQLVKAIKDALEFNLLPRRSYGYGARASRPAIVLPVDTLSQYATLIVKISELEQRIYTELGL